MKKNILITALIAVQLQFASAQWQQKSSGFTSAHRGIVEMSAPDNRNCYAIGYDADNFYNFQQELTVTHNGGVTWNAQTIGGLADNWLIGVAAPSANKVHVFGWNFVTGGGNVFRSSNGGNTWQREAANAFTNGASFPDILQFFNTHDGVMLGDPVNGSFEIYTTHNGGNSWSPVSPSNIPVPLANEYGSTYFCDKYQNTIWAVTVVFDGSSYQPGRLLQSDDKGAHWYVRNSNMTNVNGAGTIKFRNHSVGLYKDDGKLYRTVDGGTTWNQVNYSGTFFCYDFDNVPGVPRCWISTGGDVNLPGNSLNGLGSSISFDDGNHWSTLDTAVNHTCVEMTSPFHGYTGGINSGNGNDGVFVYSLFNLRNADVSSVNTDEKTQLIIYPNPSNESFSLVLNDENAAACYVHVFDMQGKIVLNKQFSSSEIISFGKDFIPGLYYAEIITGNDRQTIKLIKQ